jgi:hypothetical protein
LPIETATYINGLNASNPPDADPVGQADDHLRLIKGVLKATFPNLTGPVTATQDKLNGAAIPAGIVCNWYGSVASIPSGWALCNGQIVARSDGTGNITTPNLTDAFIRCSSGGPALGVGAGSTVPGTTGGTASHSHTVGTPGHSLSVAELPTHAHGITDPGHGHLVTDPGHSHGYTVNTTALILTGSVGVNLPINQGPATTSSSTTGVSVVNGPTGILGTQNVGSGTAHTHPDATSDTQAHLPPFVGLVAIMKT